MVHKTLTIIYYVGIYGCKLQVIRGGTNTRGQFWPLFHFKCVFFFIPDNSYIIIWYNTHMISLIAQRKNFPLKISGKISEKKSQLFVFFVFDRFASNTFLCHLCHTFLYNKCLFLSIKSTCIIHKRINTKKLYFLRISPELISRFCFIDLK